MTVENILSAWRNNESVSTKDLKNLYNTAKEEYYNGTQIMEDFEFDTLEAQLGLENKSYVGTKHNPSYTIEHPFIMGSLSKVQIHKDKEGNINWPEYVEKVKKYVGTHNLLASPKYDGCSFEVNASGINLINCSSRGDGYWGANYTDHLKHLVQPNIDALNEQINGDYTLRGEVLINKNIFQKKYSEFVNPRSFVSGILNRDYSSEMDFQEMLNDLSIVIYDIRVFENGDWVDKDWTRYDYPAKPQFSMNIQFNYENDAFGLDYVYNMFNTYREKCEFALDGIVIKPVDTERVNNLSEHRPKDCVAIKFIPMLEETEVVKIEWNVKKFGNMIPTIWVRPVTMDGKKVQKCSGSNYSNLIKKQVSVGSKVIMSLAGDIIPFLYKVTDTTAFSEDKLDIPTDVETYVDGVHLKAVLSEEDKLRMMFINSCKSLNIPGIGPSIAERLFNSFTNNVVEAETLDFFDDTTWETAKPVPSNILMITPDDIEYIIGGILGKKCKKAFKDVVSNISLVDIIKSCNFRLCGERMSEQVASYLTGADYSWEHMASDGYSWCLNENNCNEDGPTENMQILLNIMAKLGKTFSDYNMIKSAEEITNEESKIAVILTGDPNDYATKAEFMKCHPEYKEVKTTKAGWSECKILFTNSMASKTKKMQEAEKRGIEIRIY